MFDLNAVMEVIRYAFALGVLVTFLALVIVLVRDRGMREGVNSLPHPPGAGRSQQPAARRGGQMRGSPAKASTCSRVRRRHTGLPIAMRQRPLRSPRRGR